MVMKMAILKNQIKCRACGEIVVSCRAHELVECSCGGVAVDGGVEYLRRVVSSMKNLCEMSEVDDDSSTYTVAIISDSGVCTRSLKELQM